jgi:FSR family fosmidomycin resistance protein-like MFS transporter
MDARSETVISGAGAPANTQERALFAILIALTLSHLMNDVMQSLLPAIYPILKTTFALDFGQVGLLTLAFQLTASLLQPLVGLTMDRRPRPYSLPIGMGFTLVGLIMLSVAPNFPMLILAASCIGMGSSIFHPEASRLAHLASGGRHGLAQSLFQVGGNAGSALGPLAAAFIVLPRGQTSIALFSLIAVVAMGILTLVGGWYKRSLESLRARPKKVIAETGLPRKKVVVSIAILLVLVFSKNFYLASLNNYYTFYLIQKFQLPVETAQLFLFLFLGSVALGTVAGGPIGDRIGRRYVIWGSILGVLPFTLLLPYANLPLTALLTVVIGLILSSAFSAILVFAQELMPGKVGTVAGLFFGFAFGMAGLGAALLGELADRTSLDFVYHLCAYLPALGLLTYFLPKIEKA